MLAVVVVLLVVVLPLCVVVTGPLRSHADIIRALHDAGAGVGDPRRDGADGLQPAALRSEPGPGAVAARAPSQIQVVMSTAAWSDYEVPGSPYFALIDGAAGIRVGDRPFTRYAVLGDHARRRALIQRVNELLGDVTFTAAAVAP